MARILLDAGHGPVPKPKLYDSGSLNPAGWHEFHINLLVVVEMTRRLIALGHHVDHTPFGLLTSERGKAAQGYDVLISVHHNAVNRTVQGCEVLIESERATKHDRDLALRIVNSLSQALKITNRGIIPRRLSLLSAARFYTNVKAVVLTEAFFCDVPGIPVAEWALTEARVMASALDDFLQAHQTA